MQKQHNQKGFTLIEVVLVLAIGGLIFLLAFLAFQQVSRNRRDTQRRSDVARAATTYNDAKNDLGGGNPTATQWQNAVTGIPNFNSPSGSAYTVNTATSEPTNVAQDTITLIIPTSGTPRACVGLDGATSSAGNKACRNVE